MSHELLNPALKDVLNQLDGDARAIHLLEFQNATVVGQGTVILDDGNIIHDSAAEFINHNNLPDGISGALGNAWLDSRGLEISGNSVLVKRPWYRNFGHYIVDLLPILPGISETRLAIDNIIYGDVPEGNLKEIMVEIARTQFPDANVMFVDDTTPLTLENLLYTQPVHVPPLFKQPIAMHRAKEIAIQSFRADLIDNPNGKYIYVSRQGVSNRHIVNNSEVESFLSSIGFTIFYPERHNFGEQISTFRNADVIVGVKGAALTNLLFCKPACHALVLSAPRFTDPFFWDISAISGVQYSEIFCQSEDETSPSMSNITVDLDKLKEYIMSLQEPGFHFE